MNNNIWIFVLMLEWVSFVQSLSIDNNIIGDPTIDCGIDALTVYFHTRNPFSGKIYVKGHSTIEQCLNDKSRTYKTEELTENNFLTVKYGSCNVQRDRSINPRGVFLRTTVAIQFHSVFTTKVDKSYRISCFYQESLRTVSAEVGVSMLTTSIVRDGFSMPSCTYSIRKEDFNGPQVTFVNVGDSVVHRWECSPPSNSGKNYPYGMLVHSCYVNDGNKNSELVVDDKGCSLDPYILGHLTYTDSLLVAYKDANVFKFADQNSLYFSCQIRMCLKTMGSCRGMTPPKCSPLKNKRSLNDDISLSFSLNDKNNVTTDNVLSMFNETSDGDIVDVHSEKLFVFDSSADSETFATNLFENTPASDFCISSVAAATISAIVILISVAILFVLFFIVRHNNRPKTHLNTISVINS